MFDHHLDRQLIKAAVEGDAKALSQALSDGANAKALSSTALQHAANEGHAECVRLLIAVSDPLENESFALSRAAIKGHTECVRLLIPVSDPLADIYSPLQRAAEHGHAECVALLLPVSELTTAVRHGIDAAGLARSHGHMEVAGMIEAFIESQALSIGLAGVSRSPVAKKSL